MKIGSLFSGSGMLDVAVERATGAELAWVSDIGEAACKVLDARFGVENLGNVVDIDWNTVPHVDVLTGGTPCQDLSLAGRRAGMTDGTRSNLWVQMREAIAVIRPRLAVWENVRGALSARADSDMGWTEGLLDSRADREIPAKEKDHALRALGRVLGDLADLGYDARWTSVFASDVGAPHGRFRVFLVAWPGGRSAPADSLRSGGWRWAAEPEQAGGNVAAVGSDPGGAGLRDHDTDFGGYEAAVSRWERLTRPAPAPAQLSRSGRPQLAPEFAEWMMGWPEGWVTDPSLGLTRRRQLEVIGNGVCPQQATAALSDLLSS